jgi:outer membrane immunogenic protein
VPDIFPFPFPADNLIYSAAASPTFDSKGFTGGVQVGFNYQMSNLVFGLETDFNAFRLRGAADTIGVPPGFATLTSHTEMNADWLFTLRPRVGITTGQWLFYATGGLAVTNIKYSQTNVFSPTCPSAGFICTESVAVSKTKTGWAAGGGVEAALFDNWSVKGEYLFVDFGSIGPTTGFDSIFATPITHDAKLTASIARPGPVVTTAPSGTHNGWAFGGGAEYQWTPNWVVGVEYRYSAYNSKRYLYLGPVDVDLKTNAVMARLSYLFH